MKQKNEIIIYDGICVLCNFFIKWILGKDQDLNFKVTNFAFVRVYEKERGILILSFSIRLFLKRNSKPFTKASPALNGSSSPNPPVAAKSFPSKLE